MLGMGVATHMYMGVSGMNVTVLCVGGSVYECLTSCMSNNGCKLHMPKAWEGVYICTLGIYAFILYVHA